MSREAEVDHEQHPIDGRPSRQQGADAPDLGVENADDHGPHGLRAEHAGSGGPHDGGTQPPRSGGPREAGADQSGNSGPQDGGPQTAGSGGARDSGAEQAGNGGPRTRLLTARQAIEYLGISLSTLNRIEKRGLLIPFRTPGGHRRYAQSMLDEYLETTRKHPHPDGGGASTAEHSGDG